MVHYFAYSWFWLRYGHAPDLTWTPVLPSCTKDPGTPCSDTQSPSTLNRTVDGKIKISVFFIVTISRGKEEIRHQQINVLSQSNLKVKGCNKGFNWPAHVKLGVLTLQMFV